MDRASNFGGADVTGRARKPVELLVRSFQEFARLEASGGILLIVSTVIALAWANSPWSASYAAIWKETELSIGLPGHALSMPLVKWINDLLMALFFLLVGLEIKREILVGELASVRKAALPVAAAAGGMVVPGALYAVIHVGEPTLRGWGVPVATDIAFALGVLTLVGRRSPNSLKVFLASLAIADDIGALLVIALFYSGQLDLVYLLGAAGLLVGLALMNGMGVHRPAVYLIVGAAVWYCVHESGVHATIAGVAVAMAIPARPGVAAPRFVDDCRRAMIRFERRVLDGDHIMTSGELLSAVRAVHHACRNVTSPLQRIEHALHPWVVFAIVPIFALANAGVTFDATSAGASIANRVTTGVIAGLVVGKPVGIMLASWLAVRSGAASLPGNATWRHLLGVSCLAGIGFTMSLFIAHLAFADPVDLDKAKIGVLLASLVSGILGWTVLMRR